MTPLDIYNELSQVYCIKQEGLESISIQSVNMSKKIYVEVPDLT